MRKENIRDTESFKFTADAEVNSPTWFLRMIRRGRVTIKRRLVDGSMKVYGCVIRFRGKKIKAKVGDWIEMDSGRIQITKGEEDEQTKKG